MDIGRVNNYTDGRFSQTVLNQHGAYLVDNEPYQIEITDAASAVVSGKDPAVYKALIEEFRFHAPHIIRFYDKSHGLITEYPIPQLFDIALESIQPSQFFIDDEKLEAVGTFVRKAEDIVVPVISYGDRFISLDGHTRLYLAVQNGFGAVKALESEAGDWVWTFVREAERRKIRQPKDMILLPHDQYEIQWNRYCNDVFVNKNPFGAVDELSSV